MQQHPLGNNNPHPPCLQCRSNEDVARRVRICEEEYHWLDEHGNTLDIMEGKYRAEIGWAWECLTCGEQWGGLDDLEFVNHKEGG
jgi:hypothetical protein